MKSKIRNSKVAICVCTYKRYDLLVKLLLSLNDIVVPEGFDIEVFIADNDEKSETISLLNDIRPHINYVFDYDIEPIQNISCCRNKVISMALRNDVDYIAFLDDDEFVDRFWLSDLMYVLMVSESDGVMGSIFPYFELKAKGWISKSNIFENRYEELFQKIEWYQMRTGNLLMKKEILCEDEEPFDVDFGETGGEDIDFFRKTVSKGYKIIGTNLGRVYEYVPNRRMDLKYVIARSFMQGRTNFLQMKKYDVGLVHLLLAITKSVVAIPCHCLIIVCQLVKFYEYQHVLNIRSVFFHIGRISKVIMPSISVKRPEFQD